MTVVDGRGIVFFKNIRLCYRRIAESGIQKFFKVSYGELTFLIRKIHFDFSFPVTGRFEVVVGGIGDMRQDVDAFEIRWSCCKVGIFVCQPMEPEMLT